MAKQTKPKGKAAADKVELVQEPVIAAETNEESNQVTEDAPVEPAIETEAPPAVTKQEEVKVNPSATCKVIMTVSMAGIGIDWPVASEQELAAIPAHNLVNAGNAEFASEEDAAIAASAVEAQQPEETE